MAEVTRIASKYTRVFMCATGGLYSVIQNEEPGGFLYRNRNNVVLVDCVSFALFCFKYYAERASNISLDLKTLPDSALSRGKSRSLPQT